MKKIIILSFILFNVFSIASEFKVREKCTKEILKQLFILSFATKRVLKGDDDHFYFNETNFKNFLSADLTILSNNSKKTLYFPIIKTDTNDNFAIYFYKNKNHFQEIQIIENGVIKDERINNVFLHDKEKNQIVLADNNKLNFENILDLFKKMANSQENKKQLAILASSEINSADLEKLINKTSEYIGEKKEKFIELKSSLNKKITEGIQSRKNRGTTALEDESEYGYSNMVNEYIKIIEHNFYINTQNDSSIPSIQEKLNYFLGILTAAFKDKANEKKLFLNYKYHEEQKIFSALVLEIINDFFPKRIRIKIFEQIPIQKLNDFFLYAEKWYETNQLKLKKEYNELQKKESEFDKKKISQYEIYNCRNIYEQNYRTSYKILLKIECILNEYKNKNIFPQFSRPLKPYLLIFLKNKLFSIKIFFKLISIYFIIPLIFKYSNILEKKFKIFEYLRKYENKYKISKKYAYIFITTFLISVSKKTIRSILQIIKAKNIKYDLEKEKKSNAVDENKFNEKNRIIHKKTEMFENFFNPFIKIVQSKENEKIWEAYKRINNLLDLPYENLKHIASFFYLPQIIKWAASAYTRNKLLRNYKKS
jgi:hypothetical protein